MRHILRPPLPRRPEDVGEEGLHHAGRHVDQETIIEAAILKLDAICDGLEMLGDHIDMPVVDIVCARLDDMPRLLDERDETFLTFGGADLDQLTLVINREIIDFTYLVHLEL